MRRSKETKVFILGAGCSVNCGYPLGVGFATELEKFLKDIPDECPAIKQSVAGTIDLLKKLPGTETLDGLAAHIEHDLSDWQRQRGGGFIGAEYLEKAKLVAKQTLDAKIATSAMFLTREETARRTGLLNYKRFIRETLGGEDFRDSRCHVLTFNYDRLFEIAFLEVSARSRSHALYGPEALNSGFLLYGDWNLVDPVHDTFSFLKLHGSSGWSVRRKIGGGREYSVPVPVKAMSMAEIEKFIPRQGDALSGPEPLTAFPHERQGSQDFLEAQGSSSDYLWAPYIDTVWRHAAGVMADAKEVRVIGYSFNPIDSRHMVTKLLTKATCEKIIIQNTVDVRKNLESYKELRGRLDFDRTPF